MRYGLHLKGKENVTHSLPHSENVRQRCINKVLLSIMVTLHGDWSQTFLNDVQAA
jgi:hypothetical protein